MKILKVRNFEKFQHYKKRRPPWIRLYRNLWDDPRFFELNETERYFLISFFVIAAQNDNKIVVNNAWLKREMATDLVPPIDRLVRGGWLEWCEQDASTLDASKLLARKTLAERKHDASEMLVIRTENRSTEVQSVVKREYGLFKNVMLTLDEFEKLAQKFGPEGTQERIERLSHYVESKGTKYKSHYATILMWDHREAVHEKDSREMVAPLDRPEPTAEFLADCQREIDELKGNANGTGTHVQAARRPGHDRRNGS